MVPKITINGGDKIYAIFFITIYIFIFQISKLSNLSRIKKKYVNDKNLFNSISTNSRSNIRSKIYKISILKKIEEKLYKLGNPYKLNLFNYLIIKTVLFITFFIQTLINYNSIFFAIILSSISFFLPDILILMYKKNLHSQIQNDLLNIIDNIYLQLSSNISMDKILKTASQNSKNTVLKQAFISMSNVYEYTGYNIYLATNELKNKFDVMEIEMFCNCLIEQIILGENLSIIENLSNILRQKYLDKIKTNTKKKIVLITLGIGITLINISLLVFYPIFNSFSEGFKNIFY